MKIIIPQHLSRRHYNFQTRWENKLKRLSDKDNFEKDVTMPSSHRRPDTWEYKTCWQWVKEILSIKQLLP